MEQTFKPQTYQDFIAGFPSGCNSGISPLLLGKDQLGMAVNVSLRGGYAKTRPPVQKKTLIFSDPITATTFQTGLFQGAGYYRPDYGTESLLCQISGHLFKCTENSDSWTVTDISIPNDLNNATTTQVWMWQTEKWMIINDGTGALPIFFDGTTSRRSFGESQLWGTTALDYTPPAIGATIQLTLTAPYTGQYNVPVLLNGEYYQPIQSSVANSYPASLTNLNDSGTTYPSGTQVIVNPLNIGVMTNDPFPLPDPFPKDSKILDIAVSSTVGLTVGTKINFTIFNTSENSSFYWTITSIGAVGTNPDFPNYPTISIKWNGFEITGGYTIQTGTLISLLSSNRPTVVLGTLADSFSSPAISGSIQINLSLPYSGATNQLVQIGSALYTISPVPIPPPTNLLTVINLTDTDVSPVTAPAEILSVPELPAGRMGAYGMGRNWFSLIDGISYEAGDIVGGASGTPANDYRDSVLKTTENDFLAGGGTFRLPGTGDIITAMIFPPILDSSLGQGQLQIFTAFSAFSNNSPVDRSTWESLTYPLQTESLKDNGALAQNSTILVNSDTFFRSSVGIGSLLLARRDFIANTWGNKPISNELQRVLNLDNQTLLSYGSAITFDNRFISTCAPNVSGQGVFHIGLVTLNNDLLSSLRTSLPPSWEGAWSGINCMQMISGRLNGSLRSLAFTFNLNTNQIELYEFLSEQSAASQGIYQDNDETDIQWFFETPVLFNKDVKPQTTLCQLRNGEVYLSEILGNVHVKILYRPDFYPCWTIWNEFDVCESNAGTNPQAGYRMRIGLGEPSVDPVEIGNDRPLRNGYFFQFRVEITGSCTFNGMRVSATELPMPVFAPVEFPEQPCQNIDCSVPNDLEIYSLQGLPPQPLPPIIPTPCNFKNQEVYFNDVCSSGSPSFSGTLPNWLTIDSDNNRLVVAAGTFCGATVISANANAQKAVNSFALSNLQNGNLSCVSSTMNLAYSSVSIENGGDVSVARDSDNNIRFFSNDGTPTVTSISVSGSGYSITQITHGVDVVTVPFTMVEGDSYEIHLTTPASGGQSGVLTVESNASPSPYTANMTTEL